MTVIEKDDNNLGEIETLYSFDVVLFESTVLIIADIELCICYVEFLDLYDVSMQDVGHTKIIEYESVRKLDDRLNRYFNMIKGDVVVEDDVEIRCISHSIEYTL